MCIPHCYLLNANALNSGHQNKRIAMGHGNRIKYPRGPFVVVFVFTFIPRSIRRKERTRGGIENM